MASSSSSHQPNEEPSRFSGNEASREIRAGEKFPKVYDVFINHRGPDVKDTLARELYNSLQSLGMQAFLDCEEREIGCPFPYTIETAIQSATVHVAIFSPRYAESAWCLNELVSMLKITALIIPVFYGTVEPSDLRHVERENGAYKAAFATHRDKQRHSKEKIEAWKAALHKVSLTAGFDSSKHDNDDDLCKSIVSKVSKEVKRREPIYVAEHPVELDELVKDFEIFYKDRKEGGKANILAISGIGGIGKSTLAREMFNRKRSEYDGACFLSNVRENSEKGDLPSLQCKLLKDLLRENHPKFGYREDGISQIKKSWYKVNKNLRFLIVLDYVNHLDQLEAFPILKKLGNSLAIVTTREKGVLTSARISVPYYNLGALSPECRRRLFCRDAFRQCRPAAEYEEVVEGFTDTCRGLSLYLRVLGKHIVGKNLKDC